MYSFGLTHQKNKNCLKLLSSQKGLSIRHLEFVFCNNSSSREAEISWPNWRFIENGLSGSPVGARFPIHCSVTSSHVYYLFKKTYRGITRIAKVLCIYRHSLVKNWIKKSTCKAFLSSRACLKKKTKLQTDEIKYKLCIKRIWKMQKTIKQGTNALISLLLSFGNSEIALFQ